MTIEVGVEDAGAWPRWTRAWAVLIAALSALVMWPGIRFGFVFDDWGYLHDTQTARWWDSSIAHPTSPIFRPILLLAIGVQQAVFGDRPLLFHLVAWLLLLGVGVLMARLTRQLGVGVYGALGAGTFLVLHHAMVSPIAWTSALSSLIGMALALVVCRRLTRVDVTRRDQVIAGVVFALALVTREVVVGLPLVVIALRFWSVDRGAPDRLRRALAASVPLWATLGVYAVARLAVGIHASGPYEQRLGRSALDNLLTLMKIASSAPSLPISRSQRIGALVIWVVLIALVALAARRGRPLGLAGLVWFLLGVAPIVGLHNQTMVPYYLDAALLGLAVAVGVVIDDLAANLPQRVLVPVLGVVTVAFAVVGVSLATDSLGYLLPKRNCADALRARVEAEYPHPKPRSMIEVPDDPRARLVTVDGDLFRVVYDEPDLRIRYVPGPVVCTDAVLSRPG